MMQPSFDKSAASSRDMKGDDGDNNDEVSTNSEVHEYIDRLRDPISDPRLFTKARKEKVGKTLVISLMGRRVNFPRKLYELLNDATNENFELIVSWRHHGRAFQIYDDIRFEKDILPRYFGAAARYGTFVRQLYLYNFTKITTGADTGGYFHESFLRGRPDLVIEIVRQYRGPKRPEVVIAPDFNSLPACDESFEISSSQITRHSRTLTHGTQTGPIAATLISTKQQPCDSSKKSAACLQTSENPRFSSAIGAVAYRPLLGRNWGMKDSNLSPLRKFHVENRSVREIGFPITVDSFFVVAPSTDTVQGERRS